MASLATLARSTSAGALDAAEEEKILNLFRRGAGVTQILGEITRLQDPPRERLRRARHLQLVLETAGANHLTPRKLIRTLAHLESRISEIESEIEWAEPRRACPRRVTAATLRRAG
jgi:hypothetical protein